MDKETDNIVDIALVSEDENNDKNRTEFNEINEMENASPDDFEEFSMNDELTD